MKKLKLIVLIIGILVAGVAFNASAQKQRADKTASAKAYYGYGKRAQKQSMKMKKKQRHKVAHFRHTKPAKGTRANATTRKKFGGA